MCAGASCKPHWLWDTSKMRPICQDYFINNRSFLQEALNLTPSFTCSFTLSLSREETRALATSTLPVVAHQSRVVSSSICRKALKGSPLNMLADRVKDSGKGGIEQLSYSNPFCIESTECSAKVFFHHSSHKTAQTQPKDTNAVENRPHKNPGDVSRNVEDFLCSSFTPMITKLLTKKGIIRVLIQSQNVKLMYSTMKRSPVQQLKH